MFDLLLKETVNAISCDTYELHAQSTFKEKPQLKIINFQKETKDISILSVQKKDKKHSCESNTPLLKWRVT